MLASAATASARAGPHRTAASTGYRSSLRASSSALIAEISASSCSISSPLRRYWRTTPARDAGTYLSRPRAAVFGAKKAYGPCGSPRAHRQPALPHRRVCSVSEPDSTCSAPPSRAARTRRRDSSRRVGMPARPVSSGFFCSFIIKEYAAARHDDQRPCSTRVAAPSAASPSADSRPAPDGSPRSVHDSGSVICPLNPPAQTNTMPAPRRLAYKISSRCPFSGWNGWVTMTKPKGSLDNAALCRLRGHAEQTHAFPMIFRYLHAPHRPREIAPRAHPVPQLVQIVLQLLLKQADADRVHARRPVVGPDLLPRLHDEALIDLKRLHLRPGSLPRLLPLRVGLRMTLVCTAPSLRPHYRTFTATTGRPAPVPRLGTLPLTVRAACGPPSRGQQGTFALAPWPSLSGRQVLLFRASARDELTPPLHRAPPGRHAGRPLAEGTHTRAFVPGIRRSGVPL